MFKKILIGVEMALLYVLAGCAGTPPARPEPAIYQASSTIPVSFDLEVTPGTDGNYVIDGKSQTLSQLDWKLREAKAAGRPIRSVLYHESAPGTIMQFICYISLMNYRDIDSYSDFEGKIRPSKVTADSAASFNLLSQQCIDSIVQQE